MEETFKIRLFIADESFAVSVPKDDESVEQAYRDAAKKVNTLLNSYREQYKEAGAEILPKRLLAMTALHLAKESVQTETQAVDGQVFELISRLDAELEDFLTE